MPGTEGDKYIEGLIGSTAWSIPELFGFRSPEYVQSFRQDNPIMGFATSVLGSSIPYAGWYGATAKIGKYNKLRRLYDTIGAERVATNPFMVGALRSGARWAPFEAGRFTVNAAFGDESLGDMIGENAINLALEMGTGGLLRGIKSAGKTLKATREILADHDYSTPYQLQMRSLDDFLPKLTDPSQVEKVQETLAAMSDRVRAEKPFKGRYVNRLENETDEEYYRQIAKAGGTEKIPRAKSPSRAIDRLFDAEEGASTKTKTVRRKLVATDDGSHFRDDFEWQGFLGRSGISDPARFTRFAQYPRAITFKHPQAATRVDNFIKDRFKDIGHGWYLTREQGGGMYVMAKKGKTAGGTPDPIDDQWLLFKTDSPAEFRKNDSQFLTAVEQQNVLNAFESGGPAALGDLGEISNGLRQFMEEIPYRNLTKVSGDTKTISTTFDSISSAVGLGGVKKSMADSAAIQGTRNVFRRYFTPSLFQFRSDHRAGYAMGMIRSVYGSADALANRYFHGEYKGSGNLIKQAAESVSNKNRVGGIGPLFDKLSDAEFKEFLDNFWRQGRGMDYLQRDKQLAARTSPKVKLLVEEMERVDDELVQQAQKAEIGLYGRPLLRRRPGHLLISRNWSGDKYITYTDKAGKLRAMVSGDTGALMEQRRKALLAKYPFLERSGEYTRSSNTSTSEMRNLFAGTPGYYKDRTDIKGFDWDLDNPTKAEFKQSVYDTIKERTYNQANMAMQTHLKTELYALSLSNPEMAKLVVERTNDIQGVARPLSKLMNSTADKLLAPVLGANSATKIANLTNEFMFQFELGGLRLGYLLMNVLTPIQTVLPHLMYTFGTANESALKLQSFLPIAGKNGENMTLLGFTDPFKLLGQSLKQLRSPEPWMQDLANRMITAGDVEPQIFEGFMGQAATQVSDLRSAATAGGFIPWVRALGNWLPANSERFSRATSIATIALAARKVYGTLDPDQLYHITKTLMHQTMYGYKQADRAGIMTTPAGSVFGLFKNWMLNNMMMMGEYTHAGFTRNHWAPLIWQQASTMGIGGLAATPLLVGAEAINGLLSDNELLDNAYTMMDTEWADGIMYGLPAVLGYSLSSAAASPLANPIRDAEMLYSVALFDRMANISSAAGEAIDNWRVTGQHPMENERVRQKVVQALAPKSLFRIMQATQDEGIISLNTGYPIARKAGIMDRAFFALGLTPTEIERQYAAADILYRDRDRRKALTTAAGKVYLEAMKAGDSQEMRMVLRGAIRQGLNVESVMKSAAERNRLGNQDVLNRVFDPKNAMAYRRMLGLESL